MVQRATPAPDFTSFNPGYACWLRGIAKLLHQADRLAQRSVVAAGARDRDRDKALQIALDVEPLLHEADVLLTAATIIRRQSQTLS